MANIRTDLRPARCIVILILILVPGIFVSAVLAQQPPLIAPTHPSPLYVVTFVDVTPDNKDAAAALIKQYVVETRKASGIQRVEALSQISRTNHLVIYEIWQNEDTFHKHEGTQATRDFRAKMAPFLGAPFDQRLHFKVE